MRVEKISILLVGLVLIVALTLPPTRLLTVATLRSMEPNQKRDVWTGHADPIIPGPKTDQQLVREYPRDYLLRLGVALSSKYEESDKAFNALLRDFPNEPSAYALAMNAPQCYVNAPNRVEEWGVTPKLAAEGAKDVEELPWHKGEANRKRDIRQVWRLLALLDEAVRVDPDNGLFEHRRAVCLFALHRDDEALNAVHQAADAPNYTRYVDVAAKALNHLWTVRKEFHPTGRSGNDFTFDKLESKDHSVARIVQHFAFMRIKNGNADGGVSLAMDEMTLGHRIAVTATGTVGAMVGIATCRIALAALDPLSDVSSIKSLSERRRLMAADLREKRELAFLTSHGYTREANLARRCMSDCDNLKNATRRFVRATGPGSIDEYLATQGLFVQAFESVARALAIAVLALLLWLLARILTLRRRLDGLWDRRAAFTAALIAALPIGVFVEMLIEGAMNPTRSMATIMGAFLDSMSHDNEMSHMFGVSFARAAAPLHFSLIGLVIGCPIVGLVVALRRTTEPGTRRSISAAALIPAYIAAFGLVVEDAYYSHVSSFDMLGSLDLGFLIAPVALLAIYSFFRALNCRFSQVRQSGPMTFFATIRYGSAVVAATFAVAFVILLPIATVTSSRSRRFTISLPQEEGSVIRNAVR